jgi:DNA-binding IclR family transcriptional regulator
MGLQVSVSATVRIGNRGGSPLAALGVSGPEASFTEDRVPDLLALLRTEARQIEVDLVPQLDGSPAGSD